MPPVPLWIKRCPTPRGMHRKTASFLFIYFYYGFTAQVLKVCKTPGPTACLKLLQKLCLKRWRKEKKSITGPRQPRTCSHPINA